MGAKRSLTGKNTAAGWNTAAGRTSADVSAWGRARLVSILAGSVLVVLVLIGGLGYAVFAAVPGLDRDEQDARTVYGATGVTEQSSTARGAGRRDAIAAEAMLAVSPQAAFPDSTSSRGTNSVTRAGSAGNAGPIVIPPATGAPGPGFVATGFPRTPEGAIGQLEQIDMAVLQSMSPLTAREVYASWALPGGVDVDRWWPTTSVESFLDRSEMGQVKSPDAAVSTEPVAALIKGTDGPDWATVCVLLKVTATYRSEARAAFAHCERMQWVGGRWMLAPGAPPAPAPATWPGTDLAAAAGWRTWTAADTADTDGLGATTDQPSSDQPSSDQPSSEHGGEN